MGRRDGVAVVRREPADLVIAGARLVATMDDGRRELNGGWVAIRDGLVSAVGDGPAPTATDVLDAADCLVTPGLINIHHHLFQNLTRAYPPMTDKALFGWLTALYPLWRSLDTEGAFLSAWVGLAELALSGCTTSTCTRAGWATCWRPRSRLRSTSACASTPRAGRCRCRTRTAGCRPTTWWRTTTTSSPRAKRPSPVTTTAATAPWCRWRWRRARRSASPNR